MNPRDPQVLQACESLLSQCGITDDQAIAAEMMHTVIKLTSEQPGRGEMRLLLRSLKELRHAFRTFKPYRQRRKISIFGSARTPASDPNYTMAERFAKLSAESGFMVITGAGPGIMEAGNAGAGAAQSFGVAIRLPFEQSTNPAISGDDKLIHFRYFFSRKLVFVKETHAIALFPGGFGTHDEAFEVLTLVQTGRADPMPIVLLEATGGTYWQRWDMFVREELLRNGMIGKEDLDLYYLAPTAEAAIAHIQRFYSNYQSLRYVRDTLVLRIRQAPTDEELASINRDFSDIVMKGDIRLGTAAEVEPESVLPEMPRLLLTFDRRSLARLRHLIDRLNTLPSLPPAATRDVAAADVGVNENDRGVAEIADEESLKIIGPGA